MKTFEEFYTESKTPKNIPETDDILKRLCFLLKRDANLFVGDMYNEYKSKKDYEIYALTKKEYKIDKIYITPEDFNTKLREKCFGKLFEKILKFYIDAICKTELPMLNARYYTSNNKSAYVVLELPNAGEDGKTTLHICKLLVSFAYSRSSSDDTVHPNDDGWELVDKGKYYMVKPNISVYMNFKNAEYY